MANNNLQGKTQRKGVIQSPSLGYIYVDVLKAENHEIESTIPTVALENGTVITTTVIQQPRTLSVIFEMTNAQNVLDTPQQVFEKITKIWQNKELVTIITDHAVYENMQLQRAPMSHRSPYKHSLQIACDFIQMYFKEVETFSFQNAMETKPGSVENTGENKTAQKIPSGGEKPTQEAKKSNNQGLQNAINSIFQNDKNDDGFIKNNLEIVSGKIENEQIQTLDNTLSAMIEKLEKEKT